MSSSSKIDVETYTKSHQYREITTMTNGENRLKHHRENSEICLSPDEFRKTVGQIKTEVGRVIVGQHETVHNTLTAILANGHVLFESVPGLGKTRLVKTFADAMDLEFSRIQFTSDQMPADITGTNMLSEDKKGRRHFVFQPGPIFANLVLADEINRATPKTQSALLEAMQEKTCTVANETYRLDEPFVVLATQNPLEHEGTYPLPEAQLDRFFFKLLLPYPSADDLSQILKQTTTAHEVSVQKVADGRTLLQMRELARMVPVSRSIVDYITRLTIATHPDKQEAIPAVKKYIRYGSSPRGAQTITLAAKIEALCGGRLNVSLEDVRKVAPLALRHRIISSFEAEVEGISNDQIVSDILEQLPEAA